MEFRRRKRREFILPKRHTPITAIIMAIIAPFDNCTLPLEVPDAPASLSAPLLPTELAASPADGFPGADGSEVARAEKNDATELEDMAGVRDIGEVKDDISVDDGRGPVLDIDVDVGVEVEVKKELDACAYTRSP